MRKTLDVNNVFGEDETIEAFALLEAEFCETSIRQTPSTSKTAGRQFNNAGGCLLKTRLSV